MKRLTFLILIVMCWVSANAQPAQSHRFAASWQGALNVSSVELRIVFHVTEMEPGWLKATMDSPDQGAKGIPVDSVIANGDSVWFLLPRIAGEFRGAVLPGDSVISGVWHQAGQRLPLTMRRQVRPDEARRPQTPKEPFPYRAEEVEFANTKAGITLSGTMTIPVTNTPSPAVVLISGSGPQDRDESIFGHKPFWVLADHLTRMGMVVLRFDDRGVGTSTGKFSTATTPDFASDVEAAVEFLSSSRTVDPKRIGLLGHSEGGLIAPMVAAGNPRIAFLVLLAAPGIPGTEIIQIQDSLISALHGGSPESIREQLAFRQKVFDLVKSNEDTTRLAAAMKTLFRQSMEGEAGHAPEAAIDQSVRPFLSPWMRFFLFYDPVPALQRVRQPVLALFGSLDLQVPADINAREVDRALRMGGNATARVKTFPGLNHLFQHASTGSPTEYGRIEETMSKDVLEEISSWTRGLW